MRFAAAFSVALALSASAAVAAVNHAYTPRGTCDGWPRANIGMASGFCAGIVVAPPANFADRDLRAPRMLLAMGRDWLVTDMGHWGVRNGRVLKLVAERGHPARLTPLLSKLYVPHGLAKGPDGKVYVGEMGRIFRFDPVARDPQSTIETVIDGLPDNRLHENRHPLTYFVFDVNGDLLVNVGARSDQCEIHGKPNGTRFCIESEGEEKVAGIRRYAYLGNGKWSASFTMFARGLRNSMAVVRHSSGTWLQAENSIDYKPADSPFEELNVLRAGAHYGWPYCYDMNKAAPVWADSGAMDCRSSAHTPPVRLLPPHGAPLSMLYYEGAMFPALRGKLIMTLHGYRPAGARIAVFDVDANGVPVLTSGARYAAYASITGDATVTKPYPGLASNAFLITPGWNKITGERPQGKPVALAVASDGAIWVTDDKNATILRIAADRP
ncbi:MAG: PQQ-dependent sugar dehydrogenase [Alphaproteobacteria bacterium]|nr:PQQ-dependent sugar dehydrogenase [Alphaproteobacteria bacterium]